MISGNNGDANKHLNVLLELATDMGYEIRKEKLGGNGGRSLCVEGRKCLQLDSDASVTQQLSTVSTALEADPQLALYEITDTQETALRLDNAA